MHFTQQCKMKLGTRATIRKLAFCVIVEYGHKASELSLKKRSAQPLPNLGSATIFGFGMLLRYDVFASFKDVSFRNVNNYMDTL